MNSKPISGLTALLDLSARALHLLVPNRVAKPALNHLLDNAIDRDDVDDVRKALAMGADPNAFLGYATALHKAISNDSTGIALVLIEAGANPSRSGPADQPDFQPPLHLVCKRSWMPESVALAKALIDRGADVNAFDSDGLRPIDHVQEGREMLVLLIDAGAEINGLNRAGDAPLHRTIRRAAGGLLAERNAEFARMLIELGADPLMREGHPEPALARKIAPEYQARGLTPLEIAQRIGPPGDRHFDWVEPLVRAEQARQTMKSIAEMAAASRTSRGPSPPG